MTGSTQRNSDPKLDVVLERITGRLEALQRTQEIEARRIERLELEITATDPDRPGIALRMVMIEQTVRAAGRLVGWIGTGGLTGLAGTLYLLWRVLQALGQYQP